MKIEYNNINVLILCLDYTSILFLLGLIGIIINRRNILLILLSLELTFLASSLNFIILGNFLNDFLGAIYGIMIILVVIADTVIGLSLVVLSYRTAKSATVNTLISLRG